MGNKGENPRKTFKRHFCREGKGHKVRKGMGDGDFSKEVRIETISAQDTHFRYIPAVDLEIFLTQIRNQITDL